MKLDILSLGDTTVDLICLPENSQVIRISCEDEKNSKAILGFDYGNKLKLKDLHETFGGGAANTSIGFHRLGLCSGVFSLIGEDDWGQRIIKNFLEEKVNIDYLKKTKYFKSSFSIIINSFEGERTVLLNPGANKKLTKKDLESIIFCNTKWLFINRLSSDDENILSSLSRKISQYPKLGISWNPGGSQIKDGYRRYQSLLQKTNILFLNKEEALTFSKSKRFSQIKHPDLPDKIFDLSNIFRKLKINGPKIVVITDGQRGAQCYDGKNLYFCPATPGKKTDTLGAGDAFSTGFTYAYLQGLSLQNCLKFGTINAMSVVRFYGAQTGLLSKRQLQEQFEKIHLSTTKTNILK